MAKEIQEIRLTYRKDGVLASLSETGYYTASVDFTGDGNMEETQKNYSEGVSGTEISSATRNAASALLAALDTDQATKGAAVAAAAQAHADELAAEAAAAAAAAASSGQ